MSITVIRAADRPEVPWKNGGGTTREIAVFPPGAGMDDFLWRLSMAKVEEAGPFSIFPGTDRTLGLIEGQLALNGSDVNVTLDEVSAPLPFRADLPVDSVPIDGPALDLNAMVRRGHFTVSMTRLAAGDIVDCTQDCFVIALSGQRHHDIWLDKLDCLSGTFSAQLEGAAFFVKFTAAQ
ncbi:HutD family protein [Novosphingobium decolorationis]|uniref:HutD family protein n=1 Tax=Novosphingobium decolorationis TaxID=2698673 RepID=A0ABX8E481_9SPHN|nr:HutD family protein [Novosphingobium decolorationis]QVM83985.1 HutD family protein [Novosphingobium decolorationis]